MKKKALIKDILMEIKNTKNRYFSLFLITALGVAFFSGIRAAGPDMRLSADQYYDESRLMDIRVVGTMGLTEEDAEAIAAVDGVIEVMPSYTADMLCDIDGQQEVLRLFSLPDPINRVDVAEGRLPEAADECLIDAAILDWTDYEIGDTISMYADGEEETRDTLAVTEFTIVGIGSSSYYFSFDRGTSSVGSGSVEGFVVVPEDAFSLEVYTEIYATVDGALELTSYTDEYDDTVSAVAAKIEEIAGVRCEIRYNTVLEEAEAEIADAKRELADGEEELAAGLEELESAREQIGDAGEELDRAQRELTDGWAEFWESESLIDANQAEIDAGRIALSSGKTETEEGRRQLESAKREVEAGFSALTEGKRQLSAYKRELEAGKVRLEESLELLAALKAMEAAGDTTVSQQIAELEVGIALAEEELAAGQAQLEALEARLTAEEGALSAAKAELEARETQLLRAEAEIRETEKTLAAGQEELNRGRAALEEGRLTLTEGEEELEAAERELAEAEAELAEGEAEYEKNELKLADASEEIADAEAELADLEAPEWYVLDRQSIQSYVEYGQNADRIQAIGTVFPLIFFVVAALVCLTSMTRMVEEQRTQIGCLKALGYGKFAIAAKYIAYALSATLLGSLFGLVSGQMLLPVFIINAYKIMYPNLPAILTPLNFEYSVTSTAAAVLCVAAATVAACYKETLAVPAKLMRPAAPKSGKRIVFERVSFIWKRLNFSGKATARNLFRYKKRLFMTLFGIGACMALLVVGFGLNDSISSIGELQYTRVHIYDSSISVKDDIQPEEKDSLLRELEEDPDVMSAAMTHSALIDVSFDGAERSAYLTVPEYPEKIGRYISLHSRKTGEQYELSAGGAVITEKLASLLGVSAGDTIILKDGDESRVRVTVSAITENYFYHYVYLTPGLYEELYGKEPEYNSILTVNASDDEVFEEAFRDTYMEKDYVSGISFISEISDTLRDMLKSMDAIIYVLIISAALLAFIVLYNLNNINVSERMRELATLKVLGFYDGEISEYVIRENIWLTAIGAIGGIFIGKALHQYVIRTTEVDLTMFGREISWQSFVFSILLTFLFSGIVNLVMHFKLKKINMVESMKSVE